MSYADFVAFRKSLPRTPQLHRQTVRARGIDFAVFSSPPVPRAVPLLCVNGGMIYDHSMLWPALSPLAEHRQVILYDQRGRGRSSAPVDPSVASVHDDAADIGALRRALGIRTWDILGHSWGGGISMLATAVDRAGVRKLVLVDPVWATSDWMSPLRANVLARLHGAQRAAVERVPEEALGNPDPELHSTYNRAVYPAWFSDRDMASHFSPPHVTSETGGAVLARLRREGYDWRPNFSAISLPTLLIQGRDDPLPLATSRDSSYIGRPTVIEVAGSGHMPFWEAPEVFFAQVETFFRSG